MRKKICPTKCSNEARYLKGRTFSKDFSTRVQESKVFEVTEDHTRVDLPKDFVDSQLCLHLTAQNLKTSHAK